MAKQGRGTNDVLRLAAFDLDGTLLKGHTACEAIARGIGRLERMREFEKLGYDQVEEIMAARQEMAEWYSAFSLNELRGHLAKIQLAPGTREGFSLLHDHGFKITIVSVTWAFAVEWFAEELGADYSVGTGLSTDGRVDHFWPQDKAIWLTGLAGRLGIDLRDVVAVGDSSGDVPMLLSVGHRYWVGQVIPSELDGLVNHEVGGNIGLVARHIVHMTRSH